MPKYQAQEHPKRPKPSSLHLYIPTPPLKLPITNLSLAKPGSKFPYLPVVTTTQQRPSSTNSPLSFPVPPPAEQPHAKQENDVEEATGEETTPDTWL